MSLSQQAALPTEATLLLLTPALVRADLTQEALVRVALTQEALVRVALTAVEALSETQAMSN